MNIECAWCGKPMGTKDGRGVEGTSHSICSECMEKELGKMTTGTVDKVMIALEEASQSVPTKREGWATPGEVKRFASNANIAQKSISTRSLMSLVEVGRAETTKDLPGYLKGISVFRPVRGGGEGMGFFADPTNPEDPYRSPDPYDNPRGKEPGKPRSHRIGRPTRRVGKEPGKPRPDGEWNNWGKPRGTTEDFLSLSGAGMGAAVGAAAASGAVGGAVSGAVGGTVRATVTNMM
jgi:hypothetical protein